MIPNIEDIVKKYPYLGSFLSSTQGYGVLEPISKEFSIEILKYNLDEYKKQLLEFNTGDASNFKTFEQITIETINKLK